MHQTGVPQRDREKLHMTGELLQQLFPWCPNRVDELKKALRTDVLISKFKIS